ncbi:oxidoreductase [Nocardioides marmoribigeumensis]|nr:oxidoreductase [Nocardioides marmoribigeumensis]
MLVLGGTSWLGGLVARHGLESGLSVTCLARGASGSVPVGATLVPADRSAPGAYGPVSDRSWDVVVDVSWQPGFVRSALAALAGRARAWVYVSSVSAYADGLAPGSDESAPLFPALAGDAAGPEDYGPAKVGCEEAVLSAFPSALVARAGLLAGHGDRSDRFGYWPARLSHEGPVLVPPREQPLQVLDADDLASWLVSAGLSGSSGTVNAVGPAMTVGDAIDACAAASGTHPLWHEASEEWLLVHGVNPWMGPDSLPLWLPADDHGGMAVSDAAARALGLTTRPLADTAAAALGWEREQGLDRPRRAGLGRAREAELLAQL